MTGYPRGKTSNAVDERECDGRRDPVETADRHVNGIGPGPEVSTERVLTVGLGRVVPRIAREFQVGEVDQRVGSVCEQLAELDLHSELVRGQVGVIMTVLEGWATEGSQPSAHTLLAEVLDHPVVLVSTSLFTGARNHQVEDGAQPGVHSARA